MNQPPQAPPQMGGNDQQALMQLMSQAGPPQAFQDQPGQVQGQPDPSQMMGQPDQQEQQPEQIVTYEDAIDEVLKLVVSLASDQGLDKQVQAKCISELAGAIHQIQQASNPESVRIDMQGQMDQQFAQMEMEKHQQNLQHTQQLHDQTLQHNDLNQALKEWQAQQQNGQAQQKQQASLAQQDQQMQHADNQHVMDMAQAQQSMEQAKQQPQAPQTNQTGGNQ